LATFLPNLVVIHLQLCEVLQHLASISELPHLKSLEVLGLINLEYVGSRTRGSTGHNIAASRSKSSFPSLDKLELWDLPCLKGWWSEDNRRDYTMNEQENYPLSLFSHLSYLHIYGDAVHWHAFHSVLAWKDSY